MLISWIALISSIWCLRWASWGAFFLALEWNIVHTEWPSESYCTKGRCYKGQLCLAPMKFIRRRIPQVPLFVEETSRQHHCSAWGEYHWAMLAKADVLFGGCCCVFDWNSKSLRWDGLSICQSFTHLLKYPSFIENGRVQLLRRSFVMTIFRLIDGNLHLF